MEDCKVSLPSATSPSQGFLTPKSSKSLVEQVDQIVNCGVCYGIDTPLMLKCSHFLCGSCWEKMKADAKDNRVACPFCRFSLSVNVSPTRVPALEHLARVYARATRVPLTSEGKKQGSSKGVAISAGTTDHKLAIAKDLAEYSAELLADATYHKLRELVSCSSFEHGFMIQLPKFSSVRYVQTLYTKFTQHQCLVTFRNAEMAVRMKQSSSSSSSSSSSITDHVFIGLDGNIERISSEAEKFSFHTIQ